MGVYLKEISFRIIALSFSFFLVTACSLQETPSNIQGFAGALRPLTSNERAQDFDQMITLFKDYYGPYSYKEKTLGIKIETLAADLKVKAMAAQTDEEFAGYVMQFGAALKDGHVQIAIENTSTGVSKYSIPLILTPVEGKAMVGNVDPDLAKAFQINYGDEVLEVDGKSPFNYYLPIALKYRSLARTESEQHYIIYSLYRPSYMTELKPTERMVRLKLKKADDSINIVDIPWQESKYNKDLDGLMPVHGDFDMRVPFANDLNHVVQNNIKQMGDVNPFFLTPPVQSVFNFVKVYPSDAARKKFELAEKETPPIYAALYKFKGKSILLVRQATYSPSDFSSAVYMKAYMALMSEYQDLADVLVLDQTHNPGGSYCADFYNLFSRDQDVQSAELLHADRKWINDLKVNYVLQNPHPPIWDALSLESWGLSVEQAYDAGQSLSIPIPLFTGSFYVTKPNFRWSKPMLVLIDELAGSCGDMFPMIVKANKRSQIFGQRTMGLGGNVEEVGVLSNSRIKLSLTRGMFYPYNPNRGPLDSEFIENNGVTPDLPYTHTVEDYRGGFLKYVKSFSEAAILQH